MKLSMTIYRMKGIIKIQNSPYLHILQAVHDIFEIQPSSYLIPGKTVSAIDNANINIESSEFTSEVYNHMNDNSIIVIGRYIDKDFIYDKLQQCLI
jgi:G3E family GTPase